MEEDAGFFLKLKAYSRRPGRNFWRSEILYAHYDSKCMETLLNPLVLLSTHWKLSAPNNSGVPILVSVPTLASLQVLILVENAPILVTDSNDSINIRIVVLKPNFNVLQFTFELKSVSVLC